MPPMPHIGIFSLCLASTITLKGQGLASLFVGEGKRDPKAT